MQAVRGVVGVLCALTLGAACQGSDEARRAPDADAGDVAADSGTPDEDIVEVGGALQTLAVEEAPPATRRFYWGPLDVRAPNSAADGRNLYTIALDANNRLRYLSCQIGCWTKTFGDAEKDFPLAGMKRVDTRPEASSIFDVTVQETPAPTASSFALRMRVVSNDLEIEGFRGTDYVESTEGTADGEGWKVVYSARGIFRSANYEVDAQGTLYPGDPNASAPSREGGRWSAPVELEAPGFAGPPVDHLTVELDAKGRPRSFEFNQFRGPGVTFGSGENDIPLSGTAIRRNGDLMIEVDDAVEPTPDHFVIRYHAVGHKNTNGENTSDYIEGLDGTRSGDNLIVRHFIKGRLWGAMIDAHAAGTLVAASPE